MTIDNSLENDYESAVTGLLEALHQHEDKELRRRIMGSLRLISRQSGLAIQGLTAVLQDSQFDEAAQEAAAYALGAIGNREAIEGLTKALQNANCYAKEAIVRVLAAISNGEAVRGLISALATQNNTTRESILLNAFPRINRQLFEAELLSAMLHEDEKVQKIAARLLQKLGVIRNITPSM